jgi:hypothetical protein
MIITSPKYKGVYMGAFNPALPIAGAIHIDVAAPFGAAAASTGGSFAAATIISGVSAPLAGLPYALSAIFGSPISSGEAVRITASSKNVQSLEKKTYELKRKTAQNFQKNPKKLKELLAQENKDYQNEAKLLQKSINNSGGLPQLKTQLAALTQEHNSYVAYLNQLINAANVTKVTSATVGIATAGILAGTKIATAVVQSSTARTIASQQDATTRAIYGLPAKNVSGTNVSSTLPNTVPPIAQSGLFSGTGLASNPIVVGIALIFLILVIYAAKRY